MSAERYCGRKQSQAIQKVERLVQIQRAWQREIYVQPAVSLIRRYDVDVDREHHMHCIDTCTLRGRKFNAGAIGTGNTSSSKRVNPM
jgi:hypothetical protein